MPPGRGGPVFRDDPRFPQLLERSGSVDPTPHGLRAIVVVHAELVRDTCGSAVPLMVHEADRDLHARRFAREDDASLGDHSAAKEHVAVSIDGLPGLPLPLPRPPAERRRPDRGAQRFALDGRTRLGSPATFG